MGYDSNFYPMYRLYLAERVVRTNHDKIFRDFLGFSWPTALHVVDLGCGLREYAAHGTWSSYTGVDVSDAGWLKQPDNARFIRADYHDPSFVEALPFAPTAFVSLFSTECCQSAKDKYALYESLFANIPPLQYGLVGGFFYESKCDQEKVGETGGIESYQTIEDPSKYISPLFSEFRTLMRTPSKMFGDDVVEVWKFFSRR